MFQAEAPAGTKPYVRREVDAVNRLEIIPVTRAESNEAEEQLKISHGRG